MFFLSQSHMGGAPLHSPSGLVSSPPQVLTISSPSSPYPVSHTYLAVDPNSSVGEERMMVPLEGAVRGGHRISEQVLSRI